MRILFIGPTYVGDAVVASGLVDHLPKACPGARITLVCGRPAAPLLASMPGVERVLAFSKRRLHLHWLDIWKACFRRRWDWVIDLRASGIAYALLARRRSIYVPKPEREHGHRSERWAHAMGLPTLPRPRLHPTEAQRAAAETLVPPGPPVVAIAPSANWVGKIWPIERFAELARRLTRPQGPLPGARIAVLGAESDRDLAAPLLRSVPAERLLDLIGRTDLMTACVALERCALFLGNDSGLLYMSVAADIPGLGLVGPSLTLFGPARPPLVAPWARKTGIVRTPISYDEFISAPGYDHRTTPSLMDTLTVEAAEQGVLDLLARLSPPQQVTAAP